MLVCHENQSQEDTADDTHLGCTMFVKARRAWQGKKPGKLFEGVLVTQSRQMRSSVFSSLSCVN